MDFQTLGRILIVTGVLIAVLGAVLLVLGRSGLPGDIRVNGPSFTCFVPIASMILLSIVLTIVLNILIRLINRP